jgi:PncC family amidohydrolase
MDNAALPAALVETARSVASELRRRSETVAVAESAAGGLVSAALLAVPGASDYYAGGLVVYTAAAGRAFLGPTAPRPDGMRGATEAFARYEAETVRAALGAGWGVGETGAAGPAGNPYGDPPGHAWVAVAGPAALGGTQAERVATGSADREANMVAFAAAALTLLHRALVAPDQTPSTEP